MRLLLGLLCAALLGGSAQAATFVQATTSAASNVTIVGEKTLLAFHVTAPAAGLVMVFDAASVPADGTVSPKGCFTVPPAASPGATGTVAMSNVDSPVVTANGIVVVYSSSTSCFTLTKSATAYISVIYQ